MSITILNHGVRPFTSTAPAPSDADAAAITVVAYEEDGVVKVIELLPHNPDSFVPVEQITDEHLKAWVEDAVAAGQPITTNN